MHQGSMKHNLSVEKRSDESFLLPKLNPLTGFLEEILVSGTGLRGYNFQWQKALKISYWGISHRLRGTQLTLVP